MKIYDEKKLKKMGCNALLGVGQGSIRGSYLVTLEWNGNKSKSNLAFGNNDFNLFNPARPIVFAPTAITITPPVCLQDPCCLISYRLLLV